MANYSDADSLGRDNQKLRNKVILLTNKLAEVTGKESGEVAEECEIDYQELVSASGNVANESSEANEAKIKELLKSLEEAYNRIDALLDAKEELTEKLEASEEKCKQACEELEKLKAEKEDDNEGE